MDTNQKWKTRGGNTIPVRDMADRHLLNSMFYLYRNDLVGSDEIRAWRWERVLALSREAQRRGLLADPMSEAVLTTWLDKKVGQERQTSKGNKNKSSKPRKGTPPAHRQPLAQASWSVPYQAKTPTHVVHQPVATHRSVARKLDLTDW